MSYEHAIRLARTGIILRIKSWTCLGFVLLALGWPSLGSTTGSGQTEAAGIGPPPSIGEAGLDPEVVELLRGLVREVTESPADGERRGQLGLAYEANGIRDAARHAYEQAVALAPDQARWWYHLARARSAQGDSRAALGDLARALQLEPDYAPAHWRRGYWLLELGDLAAAEAALRSAAERDPMALAPGVGLARVHLQRDRPVLAVEALRPILAERPDEPHVHQLLGTAYHRLGRGDEARKHSGLASPPQEPLWRDPWRDERDRYAIGYAADLKRALRLAGARDFEQAFKIMKRLRPVHPQDPVLASNLGAAFIETGDLDGALHFLLEALEHHPGHYGLHLNASAAYERLGRGDEALKHVDRAIELNPFLHAAQTKKGAILAQLGRHEKALQAFRQAHELDARRAESLIGAGWLLCELARWPAAAADFQTAVAREPTSVEAHLGLAWAKAELGELADARRAFGRAADLGPGHASMATIGRRILELHPPRGDS